MGGVAPNVERLSTDDIEPRKLTALTLNELLQEQIPLREFLLDPLIPTQSLTMIYAGRGVGKTFLAIHIAYALATQGELLGWKANKASRVLYLDGEMPAISLQERFAALVAADKRTDIDPCLAENLRIVPQEFQELGMPDLASVDGQAIYQDLVHEADLIIVDNISTLCRSSAENKADDWTIVSDWALRMRRQKKSVLFVHHAGKGGQQRGTSKREDILDLVLGLRKTRDETPAGATFEVHFEKARHLKGEQQKPFVASLLNDTWESTPLEEDTKKRVVALHEEGLSQKEIAMELSVHKSTVSRALKNAGVS